VNRHIPAALSAPVLALISALPSAAQTAPAALASAASALASPAQELQRVEAFKRATKPCTAKDASTGSKTETPIMETPLSIQTVPQQVLQDQNATILDQALTNVSGVKSGNGTGLQESIYIRGFLTTTTFRSGFRIDDSLGCGLRTLTNVNSVEVPQGPAAILYGRVEPGGVVNLATEQALIAPHCLLEQQVGSWNHFSTSLDATGPVNERRDPAVSHQRVLRPVQFMARQCPKRDAVCCPDSAIAAESPSGLAATREREPGCLASPSRSIERGTP
jgi:iron complex outermembrane recepter protein